MINIRSRDELDVIRRAARIVAVTLDLLRAGVRAGVATEELDRIADESIRKNGGIPAFKGYRGFPGNICISVNEVVVHGIPSKRRLKEGDIVSLDVGVEVEGYFADAAETLGVGGIDEEKSRLIAVTREALFKGIEEARPGKRVSDISNSIQKRAEAAGFSVVRVFVGHGIGTALHEEPEIPNFGPPNRGSRLEAGMVLAIEPMVNAGTFDVEVLEDGWTAVTKDRRPSAHFEHTVLVDKDGPAILTA